MSLTVKTLISKIKLILWSLLLLDKNPCRDKNIHANQFGYRGTCKSRETPEGEELYYTIQNIKKAFEVAKKPLLQKKSMLKPREIDKNLYLVI
jgi:hypothetical protein